MKKIPISRWLAIFVLFAFLFNACSTLARSPTATISPTQTFISTITFTPNPTATETQIPTSTATPTPELKQFSICKLGRFRDCVITIDDLFNGDYLRWLQSLPISFDQTKVKPLALTEFDAPQLDSSGAFHSNKIIFPDVIFDKTKAPDFNDPSTIPWNQKVTFAEVFTKGDNGVNYPNIVRPIAFYNSTDSKTYWVLTVESYYLPNYTGNIDNLIDQNIQQETSHVVKVLAPVLLESTQSPGRGYDDPIAKRTHDDFPDLQDHFTRFVAGDLSALSQPGVVILSWGDTSTWFR